MTSSLRAERPRVRWALAAFLLFGSRAAWADGAPTDTEARAAYDAGARAYDAHDFSHAAVFFARADELVPNPLALKLALAATTQADDPVLAMTLAMRAEARAVDGSLADLAKQARHRFAGRVGYVHVVCAQHGKCQARIGERTAHDGDLVPAIPGDVDAGFEGGARTTLVVVARSTVELAEPQPLPVVRAPLVVPVVQITDPPPAGRPPGVSPAIVWVGLGVTALLGAGSIASGIDTSTQHRAFVQDPTDAASDRGHTAQVRTNVLFGSTVACAVVTGVVAIFFTRWKGASARSPSGRGAAVLVF